MGCHNKLKRKTKKQIKKANIKIVHFNKLLPIFNLALNFRDHRKIIVVDGKVAYTGGVNLADEYTNERQMFGYWKDSGAQVAGAAVDNLTMAFLRQWEFITKESVAYKKYLGLFEDIKSDYVVAPFVSGPIFKYSIAKELYINMITSAKEYLYITTPYFIPEETFINLLISKAKSGVSVNLIIPQVPDKKMVYVVSRDYAERLISSGVNVYTMINSFVHGKVIINEGSAIIGSINLDHRSFNQQFESAVFTNEKEALMQIKEDMDKTTLVSNKITADKRRRNKISYRIFAGILRLISPFM